MIRPTGRALAGLAAGLPIAALPTITGGLVPWLAWLGCVGLFATLLAIEFALLPARRALAIDVEPPPLVHLGDAAVVHVRVTATRRANVDLRLAWLGAIEPLPPVRLAVGPDLIANVELPLVPRRRGVVVITGCHARWTGPLRLLWCEVEQRAPQKVAVTANVRAVRQRALRMVQNREFQVGLKVERYVGDGSDFDSLREFVVGMDRRSIDWKATARHRSLLSREFRAERDHAVMLCVDTGRLMGEPLDGMPRLDHAIHAALQLGFVCLRTGDRVGLYAFADKPQHFLAPQAGVHALQAIQLRLADLDYGAAESNFTLAMTELLQRLRRRTLVVMFTDFVDSVTAELMLRNVEWLARRHLLLFVALRDPLLGEVAEAAPRSFEDVHRAVVAEDIHRERLLVLERIRRSGALVLDVRADQLDAGLVDRYLTVKRRELL